MYSVSECLSQVKSITQQLYMYSLKEFQVLELDVGQELL